MELDEKIYFWSKFHEFMKSGHLPSHIGRRREDEKEGLVRTF
jgi:hypothetical protein